MTAVGLRGEPAARRHRLHRLRIFVLCVCSFSPSAAPAESAPRAETVAIWALPEVQVGDRFRWGDSQPVLHGQPGVRLGGAWFARPAVSLSLEGYFGGTSYRYSGPSVGGKLRDLRWDVRAGLERYYQVSTGARFYSGVGFEYGEARSWITNTQLSEDGPRNYLVGVTTCVGSAVRVSQRLDIRSQLGLSVLWGRATGVITTNDYRWLGDEVGLSLGLSLEL